MNEGSPIDRLETIETKIAYLEHSVAQISDVLIAHGGDLAMLRKDLEDIASRLRAILESAT